MFRINLKMIVWRYFLLLVGLFFNALGVSLVTKAALGTSPLAAIPYSLSLVVSQLSLGEWTIIFSLFLIVGQILFEIDQLKWSEIMVEILLSFIFGDLIDWTMSWLRHVIMQNYWQSLFLLLFGCLVISLGAYFEVIADVAMLPGDAFVRAISRYFNIEYGKIRVMSDISMSVIGAIICLTFLSNLSGVREGTLISALVVGNLVKLLLKVAKPLTAELLK
ncbi:YczE/YyaS/YitT family protein [Liquorilactobacillus nagelii]|uniref:YczE/YyaS/YitT family protein n=1 Tax=Liquorilactobacillus nagelii TaxID=82688 RepID=UPI0039EA22AC